MYAPRYLKSIFFAVSIFLSGSVPALATVENLINPPPFKCDEIEVKMEITHTMGNLPNGEVLLEFKKSSENYTCFIFSGADGKNRLDVTGNKFSDLDKGDYNLYIQNKDGCTKHMKFKIN